MGTLRKRSWTQCLQHVAFPSRDWYWFLRTTASAIIPDEGLDVCPQLVRIVLPERSSLSVPDLALWLCGSAGRCGEALQALESKLALGVCEGGHTQSLRQVRHATRQVTRAAGEVITVRTDLSPSPFAQKFPMSLQNQGVENLGTLRRDDIWPTIGKRRGGDEVGSDDVALHLARRRACSGRRSRKCSVVQGSVT